MDIIEEKVQKWSSASGDVDLIDINLLLAFLEKNVFEDYEPSKSGHYDFHTRLIDWLANVDDNENDQKTLFRLLPYIFYVGREEFDTLYRVAFTYHITHWLLSDSGARLDDKNISRTVNNLINKTWFCPITDSMRINAFYHINHIKSNFRPDWKSLWKFGDKDKIKQFIDKKKYKYIVLLEDFVGTGNQMAKAVEFAASLNVDCKFLLLPLLCCSAGAEKGRAFQDKFSNIYFSQVVALGEECFINRNKTKGEIPIADAARDLIARTYPKVCGGIPSSETVPYSPFGYDGTGGLIVMYSNCPDNSLPILHHQSTEWKPLFPRVARV